MAQITPAERSKAYRARHQDDPAYRERERQRVSAWRKRVGWRRAQFGPDWKRIAPGFREVWEGED